MRPLPGLDPLLHALRRCRLHRVFPGVFHIQWTPCHLAGPPRDLDLLSVQGELSQFGHYGRGQEGINFLASDQSTNTIIYISYALPCNLDSVINRKTFQAIQKAVIGGGVDDERSDSESELFEDENDNRLKKDN